MTKINGYTIIELISKGEFCNSYKVKKGSTFYFFKHYKDPTRLSSDYREFIANQRIMIPILNSMGNIVETIVEDFELEGKYYQVKEFIPGSTNMRTWMDNNYDIDDRQDVALQFAEILKAVHAKNIIHQDLKPQQVMMVTDRSKKSGVRPILTDFDWSVPYGRIVRTVFSPTYANIDGRNLSFKSDIFTFGIILCELLTGLNPYDQGEKGDEHIFENTQWVRWVKNKDYMRPGKINEDLSPAICRIIERCLEPEQHNRPTIDEIINVLKGKGKGQPQLQFKAKLRSASGDTMIMEPGMSYGRRHFKELFTRTTDGESNEIYRYLDQSFSSLYLVKEGDRLKIGCPANGPAKNKILLNGRELPNLPTLFNTGDTIAIFSSAKRRVVANFTIEII